MRFRFLRSVFVLVAIVAALGAYPMIAWATPEVARSIVAAGIIALVNVVLGMLMLEWGIDRSNNKFMYAVFGGMGVRMGLILIALTVLLMSGYHQLSLALALMGFYMMFMITEIVYVLTELNRRRDTERRTHAADKPLSLRTIVAKQ
ncbi:MAG: hypothetical protein H7X80_07190 [bacterium]|nr:hypothetical protein [Candidatus Kapabacteria bacterium]